jgi:hypothetical protein
MINQEDESIFHKIDIDLTGEYYVDDAIDADEIIF